MTSAVLDPYDLDDEALDALLADHGQPRYRADQVREWLARGVDDAREMTNLPQSLRDDLAPGFDAARPELVTHVVADDGHTHKLLLAYPDGEAIETVLMLYRDRATVCVSTQAGCAMGCPFCATGQAGFRRQLTAGEVVRQVVVADGRKILTHGGYSGTAWLRDVETGLSVIVLTNREDDPEQLSPVSVAWEVAHLVDPAIPAAGYSCWE